MNFFKVLSITCLVLGLTGCFPGEKKIFEEQELKASSSRVDQVAVSLAEAVQSQVNAYIAQRTDPDFDPATAVPVAGADSGIVRSKQCTNGIYAYIAEDQDIRGIDSLDKGSGMQMMRGLQKRFGSKNVGYKAPDGGVSGVDNVRVADPACFGEIENAEIADGSPIVALNFASIEAFVALESGQKISNKVYSCASLNGVGDRTSGQITKQCTVSFDVNETIGDIESIETVCLEPLPEDIDAYCQTPQTAEDKNLNVAETFAVGTDWSAFFQNPGAAPLTVRCVPITDDNGEVTNDCKPFNIEENSSILVECSESTETGAPPTVINPIIQNGVPVSERDSNGDVVDRSCGYGWTGQLTAEYRTRQCDIYDVTTDADGNEVRELRTSDTDVTKETIYQMYYVAADCGKVVENMPMACPLGTLGVIYTDQELNMNQPLALHPTNIGRGESSGSTIASNSSLTDDDGLPSDLINRIRQNYFVSDTDLNTAEDEIDFNNMLRESMGGLIDYDLSKCHADGHTCFEPVLPPITVALVDRSGSMFENNPKNPDNLVKSAIPYNECWARVVKVFDDPEESCPLLDNADTCQENLDSCLIQALGGTLECNEFEDPSCNDTAIAEAQCNVEYDLCQAVVLDEELLLQTLVDGLKERYQDDPAVLNIMADAVAGNRVVDCNTILKDEIGQKRTNPETGAEYICEQTLTPQTCQPDFCPGDCIRNETVGGSVDKIVAVDDALREIIAPRLQFGSTFLYSYFANGIPGLAESVDMANCTYVEEEATLEIPFCGDIRALEDEVERVQNVISTVATQYPANGVTPLYATIDLVFNELDQLIADRVALGQPADVAFYLMTDGEPYGDPGGQFTKICDVLGTPGAFSAGFKARYGQNSKLYILDLPGVDNECEPHALQLNEPIDVNLVSVEEKTVDAYFKFDTQSVYFSELFGDTGVSLDVDGYEMCQQLGFDDEDIIVEPFDGDINDGNTNDEGCGIGSWTPTCVSLIDGYEYEETHAYCGPTCLSAYDQKYYVEGHSYCDTCYVDNKYYPTFFSQCNPIDPNGCPDINNPLCDNPLDAEQ